jgi:Ca-activated chloride channel homolog
VELRLPWYMDISAFYGEEYSTNPEQIEPQHLAPDDAMFFDQLLKPCSPSVYSAADPIEVIARWQRPVSHQPAEVSLSTTFAQLLETPPRYLPKAAAIIAYAEALKNPAAQAKLELGKAKALVQAANPGGTDPELGEIAALIDKALAIY